MIAFKIHLVKISLAKSLIFYSFILFKQTAIESRNCVKALHRQELERASIHFPLPNKSAAYRMW